MSVRTKVLGLVDVMMRVPPILVIDEVLKISMGLPTRFYPTATDQGLHIDEFNENRTHSDAANVPSDSASSFPDINHASLANNTSGESSGGDSVLERAIVNASATAASSGVLSSSFGLMMNDLAQDTFLSDVLSITSVKFVICLMVFLSAACIFMLWTRHLVMVYMFVISLGLTFLSYWSNVSALAVMEKSPCILGDLLSFNTTRLLDTSGVAMSLVPHLVAQWFMGMLFAYVHLGPRYSAIQKIMPVVFASPILLAMLPLPPRIVKDLPVLAGAVPLILTKITMLSSAIDAAKTVYNGYQYAMNFVSNFGLSALIENEWQRLNVPSVLRVFWTIRIGQEFISIVLSDSNTALSFFPTVQKLLVDGCETLTAVLGMTSIISVICHYIGRAFQWYLLTFDNDEEKSLGTVSAVLFYILALQTGLTSLAPDKRFVRLCRNLCLLITALLHFLHNIVSPILLSLSAARNPSRKRHVRALTVCAFLVITPICLLAALWTRHSPSTWLLAVTAFSVEVVVKVLVSLATYTLFLLDAGRQTFWEKLDDYLYYVRAFGNSVEFCFGILLFFNGAWILIFESAENVIGGAIRAIMMCIHAYFNIWCEARAGWSVFMKRRSAVHKISALPEATPAQLHAFDDVCAICYQEMYSAKITRCRHYFHGVCLRKWLYVQDRCPLCHEIMMYSDKSEENDAQTPADSPAPIVHQYNNEGDEEHTSSSASSTPRLASNTASSTAATTTSAAAVATAAASNTTQTFRLSADIGIQE
ncbi:protein TRC8 homolog isoform X1 [Anastrepha ludens]|uniref:protein TRC8 homolog isoform X1 n=1 Tax=Anastrepha ludens TaxID=28586 RepID=UPI0023B0DD8C|nr:protein TRC8 homolog isoform X1 [Anastrepha ludens]XP_053946103.1 protein TRC8 homolog isoform X1 [Anastrepha ludens]XP_053946104.1 protein TRC8 homolog isoform X1 [Anastrepha ludens]